MTPDARCPPRRTQRRLTAALLAVFTSVQLWATCPVTCLVRGHGVALAPQHHAHGLPCHEGSQVRNEPPAAQVLGDMIPSSRSPRLPSPARHHVPSSPAAPGETQHTLQADPPPPRPA